jgi:manganese transport protein
VLSFGLPFAVIPLVIFTSRRKVMKTLVNTKITILVACIVTAMIVGLNIYLLVQVFSGN